MNKNDSKRNQPKKGLVDPRKIKEYPVYVETTLLEFLYFKMPSTPKKTVKSLLSHHQVSVNGVPVSQFDYQLFPEDTVIVSQNKMVKHQTRDLPIIYEDEDLIAIDKPSGLLSIASDREKGRTAYRLVADYIAAKDPKKRIFVVHRLDEDTSGVLIFAKNRQTQEALQHHWQEVVEIRGYYAIVEGKMEKNEETLKDYLDENDLHLVYVTKNKAAGKLSITHYKVIEHKDPYSLLDVHLSSGRKNQIRVQLGHRGHYVIGDDKYGEPSNPIKRLGLHAYELKFTNPLNGKEYDFKAPMPASFKPLFFQKGGAKPKEQSSKEGGYRKTRSMTKIEKGRKRKDKSFFDRGGRR